MSRSFVIYTRNYRGKPAFVVSCDDDTLEWIAESLVQLNQGKKFVIGDGSPIASDRMCIIYVESSDKASNPEIQDIGGGRFRWVIPTAITVKYSDMIISMIMEDRPCHQYLEGTSPANPTIVVSKGEYNEHILRDMRGRS